MANKEIQGWLSGAKNPKIKQTIRLLKINKEFLKDVAVLRKKWPSFIEKHKTAIDEFLKELFKMALQGFSKKAKPFNPNEEEKKNLLNFGKLAEEKLLTGALTDKDFVRIRECFRKDLLLIQNEIDELDNKHDIDTDTIRQALMLSQDIYKAYKKSPL